MTSFITHSDNWSWQPPIPPRYYRGWYIENDDGEPIIGPFKTEAEATEELWWEAEEATEPEQFEDDFNDDITGENSNA